MIDLVHPPLIGVRDEDALCPPLDVDEYMLWLKENGMRIFGTGATRDTDTNKLDYQGFLSPIVLERFAQYMDQHRVQSNGSMRDSDNWKAGIPREAYIKSGLRHTMDWWLAHEGYNSREPIEDALCGVIFNSMGYLFELLKEKEDDGTDLRQLSFLQAKENPRPRDQGDL